MIDLSQETEALARRIASARHVTIDAAVRQALEASAQAAGVATEPSRKREPSPDAIAARLQRLESLADAMAACLAARSVPPT